MIAYKGFSKDLTSVLGNGIKERCTFEAGKTYTEEESKTVRSGFHCCENPFDCLQHYAMDGKNRFFRIEAAGDIDEAGDEKIACTQMTLEKELTPLEFALAGMQYIIAHPERDGWQQDRWNVIVKQDKAEISKNHDVMIAIARGEKPKVKAPAGAIMGLLIDGEIEDGVPGIVGAKVWIQKAEHAGKWCYMDDAGKVREVNDEEKAD